MAQDSGGGEKTEDATPRKLQKARQEGQVGKSQEVPSVVVLLTGISILYAFGGSMYHRITAILRESIAFQTVPHCNEAYCVNLLYTFIRQYALMLMPLLAAIFVAAFVINIAQVGWTISWKAITPKFSKINPVSGFSRIISLRSLVELIKNLLKLAIIGLVGWSVIQSKLSDTLRLYDQTPAYIIFFIFKVAFQVILAITLVMALLSFFDFFYQKWKFKEDQKMTKQEVKDEHKQAEGDPQVKSRIRQLQAQAARKRMMQDVPEADVIVTNPTHLAVALRYDALSMSAPTVTAKGAGEVAERIKVIAGEHDIPIVENKPLARNLYKMIDIGGLIPSELYTAVAEVLAYVYQLKNKKSR
jgi:flagellar biosynthetic protein FlhB